MNVKTVKRPEPRVEYPPFNNLDILAYGYNNLYPQDIKQIVASSESGTSCLKRYIDFISGNGFKNEKFSETIINRHGDTADDLLQQVSSDLGTWGGFAIHVNYNLLGDIVEMYHVPWENCRLGEEDDNGYISTIAVFPDWEGKKRRGNKLLTPTKDKIDYIDIFNPKKEVVLKQIERCGGIENYHGQILWVSNAGKQEYPTAIYDCVVTQMSTEEGLGNISYRNTRCNFVIAGILITKKGLDTPSEDETGNKGNKFYSITDGLSDVQGDLSSNKILEVEVENTEDEPKFVPLQVANYDKDFTVTSDTACKKIYTAFGQEVWHRISYGGLGFSSDIMRDAYDVYSSTVGGERRMIERAFDKIFKYWHQPIHIIDPETNTPDFTVQPLKFISSETSNNN